MMTLGNAPFNLIFHLEDGLCPERESSKRYLSDVKNIFYDTAAAEKAQANDNQLIYEFYELPMPHDGGDLAFGTSITYPGTIGGEYFMTKGHFHSILNTAEVYYCLNGHGMMMMENSDGQWECRELNPGTALYVPKGFAHRSINIGTRPLATFFCFRADAGHDYKTIANQGFRHLVVEKKWAAVCDRKSAVASSLGYIFRLGDIHIYHSGAFTDRRLATSMPCAGFHFTRLKTPCIRHQPV